MAYFMGSFSVSPASAGMIPPFDTVTIIGVSEPRIRGDDPGLALRVQLLPE